MYFLTQQECTTILVDDGISNSLTTETHGDARRQVGLAMQVVCLARRRRRRTWRRQVIVPVSVTGYTLHVLSCCPASNDLPYYPAVSLDASSVIQAVGVIESSNKLSCAAFSHTSSP